MWKKPWKNAASNSVKARQEVIGIHTPICKCISITDILVGAEELVEKGKKKKALGFEKKN